MLVWQLTDTIVVNRSLECSPWHPETRTFFGREILFTGKILPRKLKIAKIFGLKSEKSKKIPAESLYARIFPDGNKNYRKIFGPDWIWAGMCQDRRFGSPPLRQPSPPRGAGANTMPLTYPYGELPGMQVIQHYRNWGMPERRGRQPPRASQIPGHRQ